jgi:PKD repeat protein
MRRSLVVSFVSATLLISAGIQAGPVAAEGDELPIEVAADAQRSTAVAFTFRLPRKVAAVDGRVFIDTSLAEVVGLAPVNGGEAFRPEEIPGGYAFGAYNLRPTRGQTLMRVVLVPQAEGQLQFRVAIDAAADQDGNRLNVRTDRGLGTMRVGGGNRLLGAPAVAGRPAPARAAGPVRELAGDERIGDWDLDIVRSGWELARMNDAACDAAFAEMDANDDGCVDIVDVQAVFAAQGERAEESVRPRSVTVGGIYRRMVASVDGGQPAPVVPFDASIGPTFVVDSTLDAPDANIGDGICADAANNCTLRAAVSESNWWSGANRIEFNLPGTAPVRIQMSTAAAPLLNDRSGGTFIDGYSQPGSRVNTLQFGTNAIPGVEIRGTSNSPRNVSFRVRSPNNTIRGIAFNNTYRYIVLDGPDASNNTIIGNWLGFTTAGAPTSYRSDYPVLMQGGAHHNVMGTPNLADRNVSGNGRKGTEVWGAGTDHNVIQNNLFCTAPNGATAVCNNAVDLDHGPKHTLVGGFGPNERNVVGRTTLNGLEMSHGYTFDEACPCDDGVEWQINHNQFIGNWLGFLPDGGYNAAHRVAQSNPSTADNGNGINMYDGSNFNLAEGNIISAVWDGIQTMSDNAEQNVIRNNIIGVSPKGEAAPVGRWGIVARLSTDTHLIEGNTIRNVASGVTGFTNVGGGGIGLTHPAVRFVRMSKNIISNTTGPAIVLQPDPNNPSTGANNLQAPPTITSATTVTVSGTGVNGATVEVYRADRPAGQSGLPVEYLGATVVSGGTWSLPVSVADGDRVTALQTPTNGNTSTLGINVAATFQAPPQAPNANFSWGQQAGSLAVNFTDTSTGGAPTSWSWNFGDGTSSTQQNPTKTYASAGDYSVTLTASNAGGSDDRTRTVNVEAVQPPAGGLVAADAFSRTTNNGWGSADVGGSYTIQGTPANYSVGGGVGNIVVPAAGNSRSALLNGVSQRDLDLRFRVRADKVPTGAASFVYAVARRNGNSEYRPRLILNANGTVSVNASVVLNNSETALGNAVVVPGLTQAANSFIWLRAEVTGASPTTIRVKAWADGQAEPGGWNFSTTNSAAAVQTAGGAGLRLYMAGGVSNAPVLFSFDDYQLAGPTPAAPVADFDWAQQAGSLTVNFTDTSSGAPTSWSWNFGDGTNSTQQNPSKTYAAAGDYSVVLTATNAGGSNQRTRTVNVVAPPAATVYAADAFGRTTSNGWGNADTGGAYTIQGTAANYSVGGGAGSILVPAAGNSPSALLNNVSASDVDLRFRVGTDKVPAGGTSFVYAVARRNSTNEYRPRLILNATGSVSVNASVLISNSESALGTAVVVPGLTQAAGSYIWLRAQVTGASPTTIRVKAWADGQAEPAGWNFTATNTAAAVQGAGSVGLRIFLGGTVSNAPFVFSFDDFSVVNLP